MRCRRGGRWAVALAALVAVVGPRVARAGPSRVTFERPACAPPAFDERALEQLVQVELAAAGVHDVVIATGAPDDGFPALPTPRLVLDGACADAGAIGARFWTSTLPAESARLIALADVPRSARPRTIAIALAELVRVSSSELVAIRTRLAPVPSPPPRLEDPGSPSATESHVAAANPSRWTLGALADVRGFFPGGGVFFGGHAGARYALPPFTIGAAVGAWRASGSDPLGAVGASLVTGAVNASFGGHAGAVDLHVGPEVEIGWVHVGGTAVGGAPGQSGDGAVVLASVRGELRFAVAGPFRGMLDAGLGAPLRGYVAFADDRTVVAVKNATARAGLGLAFAF